MFSPILPIRPLRTSSTVGPKLSCSSGSAESAATSAGSFFAISSATDLQKARADGKTPQSPEIVAKRVEGSVQKFLKEVSLFNQSFVKNDKQTVEQMLKEKATKVKGFTLYVVGEGIEKKVDDFAAEVAAQVAAAKKD